MTIWLKGHWLQLLAMALVIGALPGTLPFAYYQLMNWVVVGAALVTVFDAYTFKKPFSMWLFVLVAVVFNPLAPFNLRADVWQVIDILVVAIFFFSFFTVRERGFKKANPA